MTTSQTRAFATLLIRDSFQPLGSAYIVMRRILAPTRIAPSEWSALVPEWWPNLQLPLSQQAAGSVAEVVNFSIRGYPGATLNPSVQIGESLIDVAHFEP